MLSTLSLVDENDDDHQQQDHIASELDSINVVPTNTLSCDSIPSTEPAHDYNESKKKQESASHSDFQQHLSGSYLFEKLKKNSLNLLI